MPFLNELSYWQGDTSNYSFWSYDPNTFSLAKITKKDSLSSFFKEMLGTQYGLVGT